MFAELSRPQQRALRSYCAMAGESLRRRARASGKLRIAAVAQKVDRAGSDGLWQEARRDGRTGPLAAASQIPRASGSEVKVRRRNVDCKQRVEGLAQSRQQRSQGVPVAALGPLHREIDGILESRVRGQERREAIRAPQGPGSSTSNPAASALDPQPECWGRPSLSQSQRRFDRALLYGRKRRGTDRTSPRRSRPVSRRTGGARRHTPRRYLRANRCVTAWRDCPDSPRPALMTMTGLAAAQWAAAAMKARPSRTVST
jgi:hypothetical protein